MKLNVFLKNTFKQPKTALYLNAVFMLLTALM